MEKERDVELLKIVVDTVNSWNNGQRARISRTNVIIENDEWNAHYTGYAQPASIVDDIITFDPALCKYSRTDRVYFVDIITGIMAWGPREHLQQHVNANPSANKIHLKRASKFKSTMIKRASATRKTSSTSDSENKMDVKQHTPLKKVINSIFVQFEKEGVHKYPAALTDPKLVTGDWDDVSFLGYPHRHMFKFRVVIEVFHDDRDIEFIQFKRWLERLYNDGTLQLDYRSCEMISDDLAAKIGDKYPGRKIVIEVSEDGENGAHCVYVPQ